MSEETATETIQGWSNTIEMQVGWQDAVLSMIATALDNVGCRHGHDSHIGTPPYCYDDWVYCVAQSMRQRAFQH